MSMTKPDSSQIAHTPSGAVAATTVQAAINELDTEKQALTGKDATGGYAGLTLFKLNLKNATNTITSWFTTAATAARTWTLPDKDGTIAMTSDFAAPGPIGGTTAAAGNFTTLSANSTLSSTGSTLSIGNGSGVADSGAKHIFNGWNTQRNWQLDTTFIGTGGFNITPSTTVGGVIFTTPVATFSTTGLAVTGALNTSGQLLVNGPATVNSPGLRSSYAATNSYLTAGGQDNITNGTLIIESKRADGSNAVTVGVFSPTGLAVTGAVTATTSVSVGSNLIGTGANTTIYNPTGDMFIRGGANSMLRLGANDVNDLAVLNASGNLGLGVTPSAWNSAYKAFQMYGAAYSGSPSLLTYNASFANCWGDAGAIRHTYTGEASYYRQYLGAHSWYSAPSAAAGSAGVFTQAMTLDASGNLRLGVGATAANISIGDRTNGNSALRLFGASAQKGWQVGSNITTAHALEFTPAAAVGGTTFTTPVAVLLPTGLAITGTLSSTGALISGSRLLDISQAGNISIAAAGTAVISLESFSGLYTSGLLMIRGNENGLNQTLAIYTYNISYNGGTGTRYCRLTQLSRNTINNNYGDIYAYFSNYAATYTAADQSVNGTSTTTSDIYFRNAAGQVCSANFSIIRLT